MMIKVNAISNHVILLPLIEVNITVRRQEVHVHVIDLLLQFRSLVTLVIQQVAAHDCDSDVFELLRGVVALNDQRVGVRAQEGIMSPHRIRLDCIEHRIVVFQYFHAR